MGKKLIGSINEAKAVAGTIMQELSDMAEKFHYRFCITHEGFASFVVIWGLFLEEYTTGVIVTELTEILNRYVNAYDEVIWGVETADGKIVVKVTVEKED